MKKRLNDKLARLAQLLLQGEKIGCHNCHFGETSCSEYSGGFCIEWVRASSNEDCEHHIIRNNDEPLCEAQNIVCAPGYCELREGIR